MCNRQSTEAALLELFAPISCLLRGLGFWEITASIASARCSQPYGTSTPHKLAILKSDHA